MDIIDLSITNESAIVDELAALDVSGQEIFECTGIQEVDDAVAPQEVITRQFSGLNDVTNDRTPPVGHTKKQVEGSGHSGLARHMVISNMPQVRAAAPESVEERLERIGRELQELSDLECRKLGPRNSEELERTRNLHLKLTKMSTERLKEMKRSLFEEQEAVNEPLDVTLPRVRFDAGDMQKLLELEGKLTQLERVVGPVASLRKPLVTQLEDLRSRSALLGRDSELLNKFHERLHEIEEDYENSLLGRKSRNAPSLYQDTKSKMFSYESRINDLHRFNDTLQVYGPILPQLADRVRQLSGIEGKLSECVGVAKAIDTCIAELQELAMKWERTNNRLEQKLSAQEIELAHNRQRFDELVANLEAKLKPSRDL
ncbi:hypothetical protein HG536_0A00550 [Torulaspora globosa]|uniref:Uncharacterized protein n=1 Tax=Torulaspora globosa TaxID=48254 RepID=A0A7G3Z9Q2_9SACH|nr:uncharacterized protein HG536_0A00550 [Torulaspora globosa]QLL30238.1 hypothetical protein HG536_0A00550 [Torulaspora globosa]